MREKKNKKKKKHVCKKKKKKKKKKGRLTVAAVCIETPAKYNSFIYQVSHLKQLEV